MAQERKAMIAWVTLLSMVALARGAIVPPPWADPASNPCAAQPRGWQLLYWPADGKCYKIFQIGAPCPETMELTPSANGKGTLAECKCPPGTAQSPRDALCHAIYTKASCPKNHYFAPVPDSPGKSDTKKRWGVCHEVESCSGLKDQIFWPRDGKCYAKFSKGPCPKGEILTLDEDGLAKCACSSKGELGNYYWFGGGNKGCYEHYTKGPCAEIGQIFLPSGECGCHQGLAQYHPETKKCYPLGEIGPCNAGHDFVLAKPLDKNQSSSPRAQCTCKSGHVEYSKNGACYRLYTRGPCEPGHMLVDSSSCSPLPCRRGRLYFPREKTCYRIGSKGPCSNNQVVLYDYNARPSVDGISYNGVCGCTGKCTESANDAAADECEDTPGSVLVDGKCHRLYSQGPCAEGEWLVARREGKRSSSSSKARCECRPGYKTMSALGELESNIVHVAGCQPPSVTLARFLNQRARSIGL